MRLKTFAYQDDELNVEVTVRRASFLDDLERSQRIDAALTESNPAALDLRASAVRTAQIVIWPAVVSATESVTGLPWPLLLGQFLDLPAGLVTRWMDAIWEQNPSWSPKESPPEKKA